MAATPTAVTTVSHHSSLLALGLVCRPAALPVPEAEDAIGHEQDHGGEDDAGDPECEVDRVVDIAPVGRDRRPPPRAQKVEQNRADGDKYEYDCNGHDSRSLRPVIRIPGQEVLPDRTRARVSEVQLNSSGRDQHRHCRRPPTPADKAGANSLAAYGNAGRVADGTAYNFAGSSEPGYLSTGGRASPNEGRRLGVRSRSVVAR